MIDFRFFELFLNFLLLEVCRQNDIPLQGDLKELNKIYPCVGTIHF